MKNGKALCGQEQDGTAEDPGGGAESEQRPGAAGAGSAGRRGRLVGPIKQFGLSFAGERAQEFFELRGDMIRSVLCKLSAGTSSINNCQIKILKDDNGTAAKNSSEYNYSALGWEHFQARCG